MKEYILESKKNHLFTCICLHGMYQSFNSQIELAKYLQKNNNNLKVILVDSPEININWPTGIEYNVKSWYNYYSDYSGKMNYDIIDKKQFLSQKNRINNLIKREINNNKINPKNIIILGESQGGTIALHTGLTSEYKIGGVIGIHTLLLVNEIKNFENLNKIPIYLFSGQKDTIYNINLQNYGISKLLNNDYFINWNINNNLSHCEYYDKLFEIILSYFNEIINYN